MMKILGRILFVSLAIATFVGGAFSYWAWRNARETRVIFLDVGQGDAILISRGGNQILIDGGPRGSLLLSRLSRYVPFWDRTIETVVMTHPDADHIGGFPDLLDRYRVGKVISTRAESPSETFRALDERIRNPESGIERIVATKGMTVSIPDGGTLRILYPSDPLPGGVGSNEGSVVSQFSFGGTDFLLTGDLPEEERYLSDIPKAEVLKLAHHGSKYSSSKEFLSLVSPEETVVSVGTNRYGHPSEEALGRVAESGALIRRTDRDGDITYRCLSPDVGCVFSGSTR